MVFCPGEKTVNKNNINTEKKTAKNSKTQKTTQQKNKKKTTNHIRARVP